MSGFGNSPYAFDGNGVIQQTLAVNNSERNNTGNSLSIIRGKRHLEESEHLEEIKLPWKRSATEEVVLRQFSNLNISNINIAKPPTDDVNMVTIEDLTDEESSDESNDNKWQYFTLIFFFPLFYSLILPEALRKDYETIKTHGILSDPALMKLTSSSVSTATPETCLALVPYAPRPAFPLSVSDTLTVKRKDDEENNSDGEVGNEESTYVESMDFAPEDSTPFSVPQSMPTPLFDSGFIFGQIDV
ncbi:unnamed protein product [Hymenolepis diminuta]|uniref:AGC-kinase C-terminal domain-containing protein n=1 Tax=Hymenolepis diminuta TaxID=6216 RepID=A0A0R3SFU0_HYMDI|nr:unnamed protein product [Hymenolepis diminuta]